MLNFTQANAPVVQTEAFMDAGNPDQECQHSRSLLEATRSHASRKQHSEADSWPVHRTNTCPTCTFDLDERIGGAR